MPHMDGWCTNRILCSIPMPSQVEVFFLPFLSLDLSFFFVTLFSPYSLLNFFFFPLLLKLFPPTYYPQQSPNDLPSYIFKLKLEYSPSTYSPINLNVLFSSPPTDSPLIYLFTYQHFR